MGCTPSIHVSQTGVVYCRDSDDSAASPRQSSNVTPTAGQTAGVFTQTVSTSFGKGANTGAMSGKSSTSSKRKLLKATTVVDQKGQSCASLAESEKLLQGQEKTQGMKSLQLGPMQVEQHTMSVLLVFGKVDTQSDSWWWAAEQGGYKWDYAKTSKDALDKYQEKLHDVVILDARHNKYFDVESICRQMRAIKDSQYSVLVAVTKNPSSDKEKESSLLPLLEAGLSKRFLENHNKGVCLNELLMLERGEVSSMAKLRASEALLRALEQVSEAVEITNEEHQLQYVNPSFEKIFGFSSSEVLGKDTREIGIHRSEKNKPELVDSMYSHLNKGKPWEGLLTSVRKTGENVHHHNQVSPVVSQNGQIRHFVSTKTAVSDLSGSQIAERFNGEISPLSGVCLHKGHRRESIVRMHSMTIEAPITQVINIINAAQENSPSTVSQSLDKVLEILRSSELYSPYFPHQVKDDQMTHDYVGGLMTTNVKRYSSGNEAANFKNVAISSPSNASSILTQASPEVQALLKSEEEWNFNIIELERVTKKKPLVHLALKTFRRFGVIEFLRTSEKQMAVWLQMIEENYHSSNSYHNSTHAADVMHATAYFLCRDKIKNLFDQMDEVACLLAAIIHDLDHPGRTNSFLVNSGNPLALLYNDLAILESHHASLAFRLSQRDPRFNIFKNLERDDFRALRQQIIDMVLATEMTKHFEHLTKFASSVLSPQIAAEDVHISGKNSPDSTTSRARLTTPENRVLIKRMLIKCADVSNPTRPIHLCQEWAYRIADEYFQQTDEEKEKNFPVVMPVFDRKTCNVPKSQVSFIDFFINDMFETWDSFCDIPELTKHLKDNYIFWQQKEEVADSTKDDEEEGK